MAHGSRRAAPSLSAACCSSGAWSRSCSLALAVAAIGLGDPAATGGRAATPTTRIPTWRSAAFLGGLAILALALMSPIEAYEGALFSVHMLQHMLLELVAAPLLLLGAPATLALRAASPSVRGVLLAVLHSRAVTVLSFPLLAWVLFAAVNWGWHFSTLYDQALETPWLHDLQHLTFLGAALLFWWPVVGADPARWRLPHPVRLFYLFLAMPQNSFLGIALMSAPTALYPHYLTNLRDLGPDPGRRPERRRDADVGRRRRRLPAGDGRSWWRPGCATRTGAPPEPMLATTRGSRGTPPPAD